MKYNSFWKIVAIAFAAACTNLFAAEMSVIADFPSSEALNEDFDVFDDTIAPDGQRRWVFRGTVRLRNNEVL